MKPDKRTDGLVVTELQDEILVYDLERHRAHCLNPTAAFVFRRCDGRTSVRELARAFHAEGHGPAEESLVWVALERLDQVHLLRTPLATARGGHGLSRRELVRRAAVFSGLLLPAITSALAPTPAEAAATCVASCAGKPFGTPCSATAPANCLCTCDGAGNCVGGCT
jgi:Coenzyme PQQ synthesis protein D (PqqD)